VKNHFEKFFLFLKTLRSNKGFSLAEVLVAAGMLGVVSLGVMQVMKQTTQTSKKMSQDFEIGQTVNAISSLMRSGLGCQRTLAFNRTEGRITTPNIVGANVPLGPAWVPNPANTSIITEFFDGAIATEPTATTAGRARFQSGCIGGTVALLAPCIYGFGSGRMLLESSTLGDYPNAATVSGVATLQLVFLKGPFIQVYANAGGGAAGSAAVTALPAAVRQKLGASSYGAERIIKRIDLQVTVLQSCTEWDAFNTTTNPTRNGLFAGATCPGGVPGNEIAYCNTDQDSIFTATCNIMGGVLDDQDRFCKGVSFKARNADPVVGQEIIDGQPSAPGPYTAIVAHGNAEVLYNLGVGRPAPGPPGVPTDGSIYGNAVGTGTGGQIYGMGNLSLGPVSNNAHVAAMGGAGAPSGNIWMEGSLGVGASAPDLLAGQEGSIDMSGSLGVGFSSDNTGSGNINMAGGLGVGVAGAIDPGNVHITNSLGVGVAPVAATGIARISGSLTVGLTGPYEPGANSIGVKDGNIRLYDSNAVSDVITIDHGHIQLDGADTVGKVMIPNQSASNLNTVSPGRGDEAATKKWVRWHIYGDPSGLYNDATRNFIIGNLAQYAQHKTITALMAALCPMIQVRNDNQSTYAVGAMVGAVCRVNTVSCAVNGQCNVVFGTTGVYSSGYVYAAGNIYSGNGTIYTTNGNIYSTNGTVRGNIVRTNSVATGLAGSVRGTYLCAANADGNSSAGCLTTTARQDCPLGLYVTGWKSGFIKCSP
jgi:type II secretory pathway pseudopilin PulG